MPALHGESTTQTARMRRRSRALRPLWTCPAANEYKAKAERDRANLDQMMLYGQSPICRWRFLHGYFAEPFAENCGHCDNCTRPLEKQLQTRSAEPSDLLSQPGEKPRREAEPV